MDTRCRQIEEMIGPNEPDRSWKVPSGIDVHLVTAPSDVADVLIKDCYSRSDFMKRIGGQGLIWTDGEDWKNHRRMVQPIFHERVMSRYSNAMMKATAGLVDRLDDHARSGEAFSLVDVMMQFTIRTLYLAIFELDLGADHDRGELLTDYFDIVGEITNSVLAPGSQTLSARAADYPVLRRRIDEEIDSILKWDSEHHNEQDSFITMFLGNVPDDVLRDQILTVFLAGAETTSILLSWLIILLQEHPDQNDRVDAELRSLPDRAVDFGMLGDLPILNAAIRESMRLYPPIWMISRTAGEDVMLGDRRVATNDWMLVLPYYTHRIPDLWRDPHAFRIDRFLDEPDGPTRHSYLPFGAGRHLCIGKHFAEYESLLTAATVLRRYVFDVSERADIEPWPGLTLKPRQPVMTRVRRK